MNIITLLIPIAIVIIATVVIVAIKEQKKKDLAESNKSEEPNIASNNELSSPSTGSIEYSS